MRILHKREDVVKIFINESSRLVRDFQVSGFGGHLLAMRAKFGCQISRRQNVDD